MATPSIAMIPSAYKTSKVYSVLPTNGGGDLAFTRASSATRINKDGLIESVVANIPRLDYTDGGCPSLLLEPQSTNLYLNSSILVTQNITTSATEYTVSFYGTGSVTFSGTYAGSLVGTGLGNRVSLTFTATAGTLTSTVLGSVLNSNAEVLGYATSYIPTTGAAATRLADVASKTSVTSLINSEEGVLYCEISVKDLSTSIKYSITINDSTNNNSFVIIYGITSNKITAISRAGGTEVSTRISGTISDFGFHKVAIKWFPDNISFFIDGALISTTTRSSNLSASTLNKLNFSNPSGGEAFNGACKDLRVYTTALSDEEVEKITTL